MILRPARPDDAAFILALEEDGMRGYAEALWGNWFASATPETLDLTGHEIILSDGAAAGCIASKLHRDHLSITKLYVAAGARRRGLGAQVLAMKTQGLGVPVRLRTLATNARAVRFYLREGFCVVATDAEHTYLEREAPIPPA